MAPELIEALYAAEYRERVRGPRRLFMRRASEVLATGETSAGIDVEIRNNLDGLSDTLKCDAVVLATGFEPTSLGSLLGDLAWDTPVPPVARDYRLELPAEVAADIYLLGGTEKTHGLLRRYCRTRLFGPERCSRRSSNATAGAIGGAS